MPPVAAVPHGSEAPQQGDADPAIEALRAPTRKPRPPSTTGPLSLRWHAERASPGGAAQNTPILSLHQMEAGVRAAKQRTKSGCGLTVAPMLALPVAQAQAATSFSAERPTEPPWCVLNRASAPDRGDLPAPQVGRRLPGV